MKGDDDTKWWTTKCETGWKFIFKKLKEVTKSNDNSFCPLYSDPTAKVLAGFLPGLNSYSPAEKMKFLLSDIDAYVSYRVSFFAEANKETL